MRCSAAPRFGTIFLRPVVRSFIRRESGANDIVGYLLYAHGVYFGILLGLLALSAYENLAAADGVIGDEAAKLATLYTDVSAYPRPIRGELQQALRTYMHYATTPYWRLRIGQKGEAEDSAAAELV